MFGAYLIIIGRFTVFKRKSGIKNVFDRKGKVTAITFFNMHMIMMISINIEDIVVWNTIYVI